MLKEVECSIKSILPCVCLPCVPDAFSECSNVSVLPSGFKGLWRRLTETQQQLKTRSWSHDVYS